MKKKRLDFARRHRLWTLAEWKKVLFSDKWTMHWFVPRHMHTRPPLSKHFDKNETRAEPGGLGWFGVPCRVAALLVCIPFRLTPPGMEPRTCNCSKKSWNCQARWRSVSPIRGSHWVSEEKQDLCAGLVWGKHRSQSNWEPVDYYEG